MLDDSRGSCGACSVVPHEDMSELDVFVIEFIATSVLVGICCSLWDRRNEKKQDSAALKIGLTIFLLCMLFVSKIIESILCHKVYFSDVIFSINCRIHIQEVR